MVIKRIIATIFLATVILFSGGEAYTAFAGQSVASRIRAAEEQGRPRTASPSVFERIGQIQERMNELHQKGAEKAQARRARVAVLYVNNSASQFSEDMDTLIFRGINEALPEKSFDLVESEEYLSKLRSAGEVDVEELERDDISALFSGTDIDYALLVEVRPISFKDKKMLVTVGKEGTITLPVKLLNLNTGDYVYSGLIVESYYDNLLTGTLDEKNVTEKTAKLAGEKLKSIITQRLSKT